MAPDSLDGAEPLLLGETRTHVAVRGPKQSLSPLGGGGGVRVEQFFPVALGNPGDFLQTGPGHPIQILKEV